MSNHKSLRYYIVNCKCLWYNSKNENDSLLETLEEYILKGLSQFPNLTLVIGGDFNIVLDGLLDCFPTRTSYTQNENLKRFMEKFNLVDMEVEVS